MGKTFEVTAMRVSESGELCLTVGNIPMARQLVLDAGKKRYMAELKEFRAKRSLDANGYFWALCDKLAEETRIPKEEIYRGAIRDIGGNNEVVCVPDKAVDKLRKAWGHNGLGWVSDIMPSKLPGCSRVMLYYGSSTYDTAQMSRLIDNIVQDCKAVGIETKTPAELALLKEEWK